MADPPASPIVPIAPPPEADAIPLYPTISDQEPVERWSAFFGQPIVRNVVRPTLTPFLPSPAKATGAAVIVAPGGGFKILSMGHEGWQVGQWLADQGIAAFVLKYRLNETPDDDAEFVRAAMAMMAAAGSRQTDELSLSEPRATLDAAAAIRLVRSSAARWSIDPAKVGMMGFSAGAITALNAVQEANDDAQPSFLGYIYGPMTAVPVPPGAPPMFVALAMDDPLFGAQGYGLVEAWRKAEAPVELHVYEKGGHGYGMGKSDTTAAGMMDQFIAWMRARGLLARS